jgi:hypothetical protein
MSRFKNDLQSTVAGLEACQLRIEDALCGADEDAGPTEVELIAQLAERSADLLRLLGETFGYRLLEDDDADAFERMLRPKLRDFLRKQAAKRCAIELQEADQ